MALRSRQLPPTRLRAPQPLERPLGRLEVRIARRYTEQVRLRFGSRSGKGTQDAEQEMRVRPRPREVLDGLSGDEIIVITWLHRARRGVLKVHPRSDRLRPLTGVFATRSPDRPNPLGLHRVTVRRIAGTRLRIGPIEAVDGTPVIDMKPVLPGRQDS